MPPKKILYYKFEGEPKDNNTYCYKHEWITDWAKWATAQGLYFPKVPLQAPIMQFVAIWFVGIYFESMLKGTTKAQLELANMLMIC